MQTAPDGTIWVIDRCGIATVGGSSCDGPGEGVAPIFQFDMAGKLLKNFDTDGSFIAQWGQFGRPSAIYVDTRTDTMYVADSELRDARTGRSAPVSNSEQLQQLP